MIADNWGSTLALSRPTSAGEWSGVWSLESVGGNTRLPLSSFFLRDAYGPLEEEGGVTIQKSRSPEVQKSRNWKSVDAVGGTEIALDVGCQPSEGSVEDESNSSGEPARALQSGTSGQGRAEGSGV